MRVAQQDVKHQNGAVLPERSAPPPFTRPDWTEFRDIDRITARAGVPRKLLPKVVVKELVDNALDAGDNVVFGFAETPTESECRLYVADDGNGIGGTDEEVAALFSISRPLTSSKTLKRPTRGMLGNGLRVVAGVVLVSGGELKVSTRGRTLTLAPVPKDGTTSIVKSEPWAGRGTRIEVAIRGDLAREVDRNTLFDWAEEARALTTGTKYTGRSSPWWYSAAAFYELLQAAGTLPIEELIGQLEGLSAKEKINAVITCYRVGSTRGVGDGTALLGKPCAELTPEDAADILRVCRHLSKPVNHDRLGRVGPREDFTGYARETGTFTRDGAAIPFVVEAWAIRDMRPGIMVCVNRTPVVTQIGVYRDEKGVEYTIHGGGLSHGVEVGRRSKGDYRLVVNVIAPLVPLTSSGKDPDLSVFVGDHGGNLIALACHRAVKKAKRVTPREGGSQKDTIIEALPSAIDALSGLGKCIFSLRQLYYHIRPKLIAMLGEEPDYNYFSKVIGDHEDEKGGIANLYRDDRGTLYHPHTGESISLGTRAVSGYERPAWGFNKILYSEKEGFFPILQQAGFPERFDCALLTSKGFATRAARDVLRLMVDTDEPITFYCIHDADGPGTVIYQSLRDELDLEGVKVYNLGLDPGEARDEMKLTPEPVNRPDGKKVPVGRYLPKPDQQWLQRNRIELNAMTTPQFIAWLEGKMKAHGAAAKVIPPNAVIHESVADAAREAITERLTQEAIRNANIPERVEQELSDRAQGIKAACESAAAVMPSELEKNPEQHWTDVTSRMGREAAGV